jgi:hypothetical protein
VEVADDDTDEFDVDLQERSDSGVAVSLLQSLRKTVPEVEGDADDVEVFDGGAGGDELDEGEESVGVLDDERFVPLSRLD